MRALWTFAPVVAFLLSTLPGFAQEALATHELEQRARESFKRANADPDGAIDRAALDSACSDWQLVAERRAPNRDGQLLEIYVRLSECRLQQGNYVAAYDDIERAQKLVDEGVKTKNMDVQARMTATHQELPFVTFRISKEANVPGLAIHEAGVPPGPESAYLLDGSYIVYPSADVVVSAPGYQSRTVQLVGELGKNVQVDIPVLLPLVPEPPPCGAVSGEYRDPDKLNAGEAVGLSLGMAGTLTAMVGLFVVLGTDIHMTLIDQTGCSPTCSADELMQKANLSTTQQDAWLATGIGAGTMVLGFSILGIAIGAKPVQPASTCSRRIHVTPTIGFASVGMHGVF